MKVTIALLLFIQTSFAQAPKRPPLAVGQIIFNPSNYEPGRFVIAYKDYEDIRIDSDWDGNIDLWRLKKGPLEVEVSYNKGSIQTYYVKKIVGSQIREALYRNSNNKLKVAYSKVRPLQKWYFDAGVNEASDFALCSAAEPATRKAQAELAEMQKSVFTDFMSDGGFDPTCDSILSRREKQQITSNLARILFGQDPMEKCFQEPQFKAKLTKSDADLLGLKGVEVSYHLQKQSLMKPAEQKKGFIRCQTDEDKKNFKPMEATEDGKFVVHKLKEDSEVTKFSVEMITHEFLHLSGIENEDLVDKVQGTCGNFAKTNKRQSLTANLTNNTSVFSVTLKGNVVDGAQSSAAESSAEIASEASKPQNTPQDNPRIIAKQPAASGSRTIASESSVNMKDEMAVAQVATPEPATLSRMISDPPPRTEEGAVAALSQSASESSSTLRMANNMMGALSTPSIASESLAKSDRAESSRSPTVRNINSKPELGQANKVKEVNNNFATLTKSTLKSDERVIESITLNGSSVPADTTSRSASGSIPASLKTKSAEARSDRAPASELASSDSARVSPSATSRSALGATATSESPAGIMPKNNLEAALEESPKRGPASTPAGGKNSSSAANTAVKEETITFVANGSYSTVKSKLKDSAFSKQLETQKITILDLYGNSYGAPKGEVVFLDQGDRFVRQK